MIKLYYTGAPQFNESQTLASKSLGGYISNTAVPNGVINSLFTPLSTMEFFKNKKVTEYIGLGLYLFFFDGETSYDKIKLKFTLDYSEENNTKEAELFKDICTYKIGIAPLSGDTVSGFYMESITTGAKPYYLIQDFKELKFPELNQDSKIYNPIEFDNIELNDKGIGIWINRIFDPDVFKSKFGFDSDYWIEHERLPNIDFSLNINIDFEGYSNEIIEDKIE